MDDRDSRLKVIGALTAVQLLFGVHYLAAKLVMAEIPPRAWALLRIGLAALIILPLVVVLGRRIPRGRKFWEIAGCSVFGVVINQVCFVEGLARTAVIHSALINTTIPVSTLVFAVLLGREKITPAKLFSLGFALLGVVLILRPWAAAAGSPTLTGDLLTVANSMSYAFFLVISKKALQGVDPLGALAVLMVSGAVGIASVGFPQLAQVPFAALSARTLWLAAYIVLGATVGTYFLIYFSLARAEASLVAFFTYLQPLVAALLGIVALGERLDASVLGGGALIFLGVFFVVRKRG